MIPSKPDDDLSFHPVIQDPQSPTWIAILWGFITPCFFLCQTFHIKFITSKYNFHARTTSFGSTSFGSFIILLVGILWYWRVVEPLDLKLFLIGTAGSMIDAVAKSYIQAAFAKGPAGSVAALAQMQNILLVMLDAFRLWKVPTGLEILGFFLCITGGLCLVLKE